MGLRINTNIAALNAAARLRKSSLSLNRTLERLSSGLRINRARDDAAGLAIAEGFRSVARGARVAQLNSQQGISLVQTAEAALGETSLILQRIRELAVQSANGTQSDANRKALDLEVQLLLEQIDDIALDTEYNGFLVLSSAGTLTLQAGADVGQTLNVIMTGAKTTDLKITTVNVSSMVTAVSTLMQIDSAIDIVTTQRAQFGSYHNRLEFTISTLQIQEENSTFSESIIRDADIALETIEFTRSQILVSAGTSVLAQANVIPQAALQLLGG